MSEELAVMDNRFEALSVHRDPEVVLEEARKAARALTTVINAKKKKVVFNGETYLENEDWLTVARFYGVTSRIRVTNYIEYGDVCGFEATAEAFLPGPDGGQVISMAEAMCLNDEPNWSKKPLFQLRSMAQTRASSRVLRQVFGWVVVLAGYKPTPAEEIDEETRQPSKKAKPAPPANTDVICADCRATNGHLPSCKHANKQTSPPAPPEAAKPSPQEAAASGLQKVAALILGIERLNTKADAKGKTRPYMRLRVVAADDTEGFLYVWHATPQGHLTDAVIDKPLLCEVSAKKQGDKDYYSVENILEVGGVPWSNNMPSPKDDDF